MFAAYWELIILTFWFGVPHSPGLVALSVVVAICSGYVGLGLAAQAADAFGLHRRGLLAGAAWSLGLGIWTMHFIGMQAAELPKDTLYLVLLTLLSFLLCVLVVGIAAFIVSNKGSRKYAVPLAAFIMGTGIVLMHYLGMHAITGKYMMHHDLRFSFMAALIAVAASYGALHMFELEVSKRTLSTSSVIFGFAVSGMHYTAMMGTQFIPIEIAHMTFGPSVSSDALMIVVAVLAFIVSAVFLLYLVPERNPETIATPVAPERTIVGARARLGNATVVPVENEGATRLFPVLDIHAIQATTHYSLIFDGRHEHFSPWSISEMETRLDKSAFMRVHRSHLIAVGKVQALRKSGDSAVVETGIDTIRMIPVSRTHYAELKSRLGLRAIQRTHLQSRRAS
jgi:NO-binding membrane sensor protein with MHYT domain